MFNRRDTAVDRGATGTCARRLILVTVQQTYYSGFNTGSILRAQGVKEVGHKFSLLLNREITDEESVAIKEAGCAGAVFCTGLHPTNPDLPVTKMDFDDEVSPSLAEAIESALEAVKNVEVPDLSIPGLTVPAQPVQSPDEQADAAAPAELPAAAEAVVASADAADATVS